MPTAVTGELIGDEMQQLCGRSKEFHRSSVDVGIIWVVRDVLGRCLRLDGGNPMVGDCL